MGVHLECHHRPHQIFFHSGDFHISSTNHEIRLILAGQDFPFVEDKHLKYNDEKICKDII